MMTREQAATAMGMPLAEIIEVTEAEDGHVVTTHDGIHTLVGPDGTTGPYTWPEPEDLTTDAATDVAADTLDGEPTVTGAAVDTNGDGLPDGTAEQIMAWVDGDPQRAEQALAAETAREKPRAGLTAALEKLAQP